MLKCAFSCWLKAVLWEFLCCFFGITLTSSGSVTALETASQIFRLLKNDGVDILPLKKGRNWIAAGSLQHFVTKAR